MIFDCEAIFRICLLFYRHIIRTKTTFRLDNFVVFSRSKLNDIGKHLCESQLSDSTVEPAEVDSIRPKFISIIDIFIKKILTEDL